MLVESVRIQPFCYVIVHRSHLHQRSPLHQSEKRFVNFHFDRGTVMEGGGNVNVYISGSDGAMAQAMGDRQVRFEITEQLQFSVGKYPAGHDDETAAAESWTMPATSPILPTSPLVRLGSVSPRLSRKTTATTDMIAPTTTNRQIERQAAILAEPAIE
ncbi:MAG: hypothetical protein OXF79_29305 [Chloroflexi bacterium]|nr:hypothetical protein [Chloroflexota bacterium]